VPWRAAMISSSAASRARAFVLDRRDLDRSGGLALPYRCLDRGHRFAAHQRAPGAADIEPQVPTSSTEPRSHKAAIKGSPYRLNVRTNVESSLARIKLITLGVLSYCGARAYPDAAAQRPRAAGQLVHRERGCDGARARISERTAPAARPTLARGSITGPASQPPASLRLSPVKGVWSPNEAIVNSQQGQTRRKVGTQSLRS
jgi:hypothetical protein